MLGVTTFSVARSSPTLTYVSSQTFALIIVQAKLQSALAERDHAVTQWDETQRSLADSQTELREVQVCPSL